jgi:hypothetical protein
MNTFFHFLDLELFCASFECCTSDFIGQYKKMFPNFLTSASFYQQLSSAAAAAPSPFLIETLLKDRRNSLGHLQAAAAYALATKSPPLVTSAHLSGHSSITNSVQSHLHHHNQYNNKIDISSPTPTVSPSASECASRPESRSATPSSDNNRDTSAVAAVAALKFGVNAILGRHHNDNDYQRDKSNDSAEDEPHLSSPAVISNKFFLPPHSGK